MQWCQTDPVKGHVAGGFHSNQARTHLIQIRCALAWLADPRGPLLDQFDTTSLLAVFLRLSFSLTHMQRSETEVQSKQ